MKLQFLKLNWSQNKFTYLCSDIQSKLFQYMYQFSKVGQQIEQKNTNSEHFQENVSFLLTEDRLT